jgi:hypothetical protein
VGGDGLATLVATASAVGHLRVTPTGARPVHAIPARRLGLHVRVAAGIHGPGWLSAGAWSAPPAQSAECWTAATVPTRSRRTLTAPERPCSSPSRVVAGHQGRRGVAIRPLIGYSLHLCGVDEKAADVRRSGWLLADDRFAMTSGREGIKRRSLRSLQSRLRLVVPLRPLIGLGFHCCQRLSNRCREHLCAPDSWLGNAT